MKKFDILFLNIKQSEMFLKQIYRKTPFLEPEGDHFSIANQNNLEKPATKKKTEKKFESSFFSLLNGFLVLSYWKALSNRN